MSFDPPLPGTASRPQLLTFGLFVTPDPAQNPIDPPERFTGYHAGLDFEIFSDEAEKDIPVLALCDGKILISKVAEGYGGVLVQHCIYRGQDITVLYGHLMETSLLPAGELARTGQQIALLGAARSTDTDGNRKHLHLGIHKGRSVVLLGYVQTPEELGSFIDPAVVLGLPTHPWPSSASDGDSSER